MAKKHLRPAFGTMKLCDVGAYLAGGARREGQSVPRCSRYDICAKIDHLTDVGFATHGHWYVLAADARHTQLREWNELIDAKDSAIDTIEI